MSQIDDELLEIVNTNLPSVTAGLAGLYFICAILQPILVPKEVSGQLVYVCVITSNALLGLAFAIKRGVFGPRWGHWVAALISSISVVSWSIQLVLSSYPMYSVSFILLIVAAGSFLLEPLTFSISLMMAWMGWFLTAALNGFSSIWSVFGLFLVVSTLLSILTFSARVKNFRSMIRQKLKVVQSARLAVLGEMTSNIAHEIHNPLTAIQLNASFLVKAVNSDLIDRDLIRTRAEKMSQVIDRISAIINGLRIVTRKDARAPTTSVDLRKIVTDSLELLRERIESAEVAIIVEVRSAEFCSAGPMPRIQNLAGRYQPSGQRLGCCKEFAHSMDSRGTPRW